MNKNSFAFAWLVVAALWSGTGCRPNHPVSSSFQPEKMITCEDTQRFWISEREAVETADVILNNEDWIVVEKRHLRLTLYRNGMVFKRYTVAIGKAETPSPVGEWKIIHKGGSWGGGFGARWLGLNVPWGTYGIHGTDKPESIGQMSSHGCIRMNNKAVTELYNLVKVGTPVHIIGAVPRVKLRKRLQRGSVGQDVLALQYALREHGWNAGAADARFGPLLEASVHRLQYYYGLPLTGSFCRNEQSLVGLYRLTVDKKEK